MNDKSTLSSVRLLGKENWVKIEERPNCFYCARKFRPFSLKRHCRSCGEVVCSSCYRRRRVRVTSTLEVTVQLCFDCIDKAMLVAESDNIHASVPVMERKDSMEKEDETEVILLQKDPQAKKRIHLDSTLTSSTSVCSHYSDFSSSECVSEPESDINSSNQYGNLMMLISQRGSRRGRSMNDTDLVSQHEQPKTYEAQRHESLTRLNVLDTEPEKEYDAVCELVRQIFDCNVAAVAFMDETRQWYKARFGIAQADLPREIAFCSQLLQTSLPTIVMDATKDPRFSHNPLVTGSANIRFYASTPICDPITNIVIGSVFVMDSKLKQSLPLQAMDVLSYASSTVEQQLLQRENLMSSINPSSSLVKCRKSMPSFSEFGAASLESVPEELEDGDFLPCLNTPSLSSTGGDRGSRRRRLHSQALSSASNATPRYKHLNPSVTPSSSASTKAPTSTNAKLSIADLVGVEPTITAPAETAPIQPQGLESSCFELLNRITTTQSLLARQHSTMMVTLAQHSSRISSIENTIFRIESILSTQNMHSMPHPRTRHPANL